MHRKRGPRAVYITKINGQNVFSRDRKVNQRLAELCDDFDYVTGITLREGEQVRVHLQVEVLRNIGVFDWEAIFEERRREHAEALRREELRQAQVRTFIIGDLRQRHINRFPPSPWPAASMLQQPPAPEPEPEPPVFEAPEPFVAPLTINFAHGPTTQVRILEQHEHQRRELERALLRGDRQISNPWDRDR